MPQHISTRLQRARDRHRPRIVRRDEIVCPPVSRRRSTLEADLVNFGEFERGFVDGGAVVVGARGQVVEDGALMAGRPGVPEELHGLAGDDGDVRFAGCAGFVADDVAGLIAVGGDLGVWVLVGWLVRGVGVVMGTYEAGVKGCGAPACDGRRVGLVIVVEVPAWVELAASFDEVDEAVGRGFGDELD